jgi:succinate dehydrogenase hydrophobic anchor subunit
MAGNGTAHHKLHGLGGLGLLAFFTAAMWYCKLEMDEVIMDYLSSGARSTSLLLNKLAAFLTWAIAAYVVIKLAFLG